MDKKPIEIPVLSQDDFAKLLPPNMSFTGLSELIGHISPDYLRQIVSKMNSYTWFRFIETESKNFIFKKMATRILYRLLKRESIRCICAGNENGFLFGKKAIGLSSRGVNYKSVNEDGIGIFEQKDRLLLVVCDGVGDCLVGEVASYVILDQFRKYPDKSMSECFTESVKVLIQLGQDLVSEIPEFITFPNEVSQAAVTSVEIKGDQCEIGQVGDVLLYHYRNGQLKLLDQNRHWLDLEQLKRMFADEQYLSQRHIITNAIGANYDPYWVPAYLTLEKGDMLILASDGLETLHPQEILNLIQEEKAHKSLLGVLYKKVIESGFNWNTAGAPSYTKPDNISIILYQH